MTDKRYTDEEIVKALECCLCDNSECLQCQNKELCKIECDELATETIDLINRQKETIETLRKCVEQHHIIRKDSKSPLSLLTKEIRVEAYKEFAKEVNEEIKKAYNNNSGVLREHLEKHKEKPDFEFVAAIQGKMNTLRGLDDFIDNLLKEMVGE